MPTVFLSPVGGVAAQFFDNSGNPLTGGKISTYLAGTTTPATTYTTAAGSIAQPNPIVLDSAGRVPNSGEIWLTDGIQYKFVLADSNDVVLATYDNLTGINSNFVNYTNSQEIQTATASQTVFTLTTMAYQPGTNSLSVFVDGVNQYGPGAQYAFVETDATTVTFVSGLHVGASVKFTTSQINSSAATDASQVSYEPPFSGSVATNVENKLAQYVSVKDFGAVGDGATDDTTAIQSAIDYVESIDFGGLTFPVGTYKITDTLNITKTQSWFGTGGTISGADSDYTTDAGTPNVVTGGVVIWQSQIDKDGLLVQQTGTYRIVLNMENITWIGQITSGGVGPGGTSGNGILVNSIDGNYNIECHFYNVNISYFREYGLALLDGYYGSTFDVMTISGCGKSGINCGSNLVSQGEFSFSNIRAFGNGTLGSGETEEAGIVIQCGGAGISLQRISCTSNKRVGLYLNGVGHQVTDYQSESFPSNNSNCRNLIIEGCQPNVLRANFSPPAGFLGKCIDLRSATNGYLVGLNFYSTVDPTGYQIYEDASSGTNVIAGSSATGTVYKQLRPYDLYGFGANAYRWGTQTNDDASSGCIGEFVTATVAAGSAVALTTTAAKTIASISLPPGDWDVSAVGDFTLTGATTSYFRTGINVTTDTMPSQTGGSGIGTDPLVRMPLVLTTTTTDYGQTLPPVRVKFAATTTLYLVCEATFSAGTVAAFGTIRARRMR